MNVFETIFGLLGKVFLKNSKSSQTNISKNAHTNKLAKTL